MTVTTWEKRLRSWRSEFASGSFLVTKAHNGIADSELWDKVECTESTMAFSGEDGFGEVIRRVRKALNLKGVYLQGENMDEHMRPATRQPGGDMESFVYEMSRGRKRLAEPLGLSGGEEHLAINDRLRGLHILRKSRVRGLEQRQIKRKNLERFENPDEAVSSKFVGASLKRTFFDVHEVEAEQRR